MIGGGWAGGRRAGRVNGGRAGGNNLTLYEESSGEVIGIAIGNVWAGGVCLYQAAQRAYEAFTSEPAALVMRSEHMAEGS